MSLSVLFGARKAGYEGLTMDAIWSVTVAGIDGIVACMKRLKME